jgi:hypothetical protein
MEVLNKSDFGLVKLKDAFFGVDAEVLKTGLTGLFHAVTALLG